jgi:hypothetical protein
MKHTKENPVQMRALTSAIEFLRENWKGNDGAEGESVHLVCAAAELLHGEMLRLQIEFRRRDLVGDLLPASIVEGALDGYGALMCIDGLPAESDCPACNAAIAAGSSDAEPVGPKGPA